jgi:hypothetical protein
MYVFVLEEVPGNYIKFPKLAWALCKVLADTTDRDKAFISNMGLETHRILFLLFLWLPL